VEFSNRLARVRPSHVGERTGARPVCCNVWFGPGAGRGRTPPVPGTPRLAPGLVARWGRGSDRPVSGGAGPPGLPPADDIRHRKGTRLVRDAASRPAPQRPQHGGLLLPTLPEPNAQAHPRRPL